MIDVHPSQLVTGDEVSIRWSKDGEVTTYSPFDLVLDYKFDLGWETRDVIRVGDLFPVTEKVSLRGKLDLSVVTNIGFEMPDDVWIELGVPFQFLENGDQLTQVRRGEFLVLNDASSLQPNGLVQHQYSLLGQGGITVDYVQLPNTMYSYWGAAIPIEIDNISLIDVVFGSIDVIRVF